MGGGGGLGWGLQSHFRVQPNNCVKDVLRCVVVGVVTICLNQCSGRNLWIISGSRVHCFMSLHVAMLSINHELSLFSPYLA